MVYGYAEDSGEKTNSPRVLRGGNKESQGKRRAGKVISAKTLRRREEIISKLIGEVDLLQDLSVRLAFRFANVRKFGKQPNLHRFASWAQVGWTLFDNPP